MIKILKNKIRKIFVWSRIIAEEEAGKNLLSGMAVGINKDRNVEKTRYIDGTQELINIIEERSAGQVEELIIKGEDDS